MSTDRSAVVQVLREARALIADKKRWTYGTYARNRRSIAVDADDPSAVRWCAHGALSKVSRSYQAGVLNALHAAARRVGGDGASPFVVNDVQGHRGALAMYDRAIALAEASE